MEDKVISFEKGIHREPSLGRVGELSDCVNIYGDGGEMKLLPRPVDVADLGDYETALCIHANSGVYKHIIVKYDSYTTTEDGITIVNSCNRIGWRNFGVTGGVNDIINLGSGETINDVTTIGNVLVVASSVKMYYFLWTEVKNIVGTGSNEKAESEWKYIDYSLDSIEDLEVRFSLKGEYEIDASNGVELANLNKVENAEDSDVIFSWAHTLNKEYYNIESSKITLGETNKIKANKQYIITVKGGTKRFFYAVCGIKEGATLTSQDVNSEMDVYCGDWSTSGRLTYDKNYTGERKLRILSRNTAESGGTFIAPSDYTRLFIITNSLADRSGFIIKCTTKSEEVKKYEYAINKTDSSGVDVLKGELVKFIKKEATSKNRFMYPFFARMAVKLKDGSYIKHSQPVLMVPNSGCVPNCYINQDLSGDTPICPIMMTATCCDLEYWITRDNIINQLKERSEIIEGIVIAVTSPNYTYDTAASSEKINEYLYLDDKNIYGSGCSHAMVTNINATSTEYEAHDGKYALRTEEELVTYTKTISPKYRVTLPEVENQEKKMLDNGIFYIVKEIKLDDIGDGVCTVEMERGVLETLESRKILEDDATSNKSYNAKTLYPYNNRLTLGNISERYFEGYNPSLMSGYIENSNIRTKTSGIDYDGWLQRKLIAVITINVNNKEYKAISRYNGYCRARFNWFYYPNVNAKAVDVYIEDKRTVTQEEVTYEYLTTMQLEKHPVLNGAYWMGNIDELIYEIENKYKLSGYYRKANKLYPSIIKPIIELKNRCISSILNNPFVIDGLTINTIGMGEVQKLIANTKALSQGQFGSHPVLAFCSDGIWALSVSEEGGFSAVQPISRDVCNNVGAITQTDNAVVFTSARGLMLIDGSNVRKLCEVLDNKETFDLSVLSKYYGGKYVDDSELLFTEILKTCKILYDYENSLLWIYPYVNGDEYDDGDNGEMISKYKRRAYVVSIKTEEVYSFIDSGYDEPKIGVSNVLNGPEAVVVDYPYSYAQFYTTYMPDRRLGLGLRKSKSLYAFKKDVSDDNEIKNAVLLTRPIPFDEAYTMKMLYDMKVEGMKTGSESSFGVAVYVSNDRVKWKELKSLKARSYKWYRFAVFCRMNDYDRLTGLICRIDKRRENKIR